MLSDPGQLSHPPCTGIETDVHRRESWEGGVLPQTIRSREANVERGTLVQTAALCSHRMPDSSEIAAQ